MPAATFKQWASILYSELGCLSRPEAKMLSQWSFGAILATSCGLTKVATLVSETLGESFDAVRQRLREFYCEAGAKAGHNRRHIDVTVLFARLLRWIVRLWRS